MMNWISRGPPSHYPLRVSLMSAQSPTVGCQSEPICRALWLTAAFGRRMNCTSTFLWRLRWYCSVEQNLFMPIHYSIVVIPFSLWWLPLGNATSFENKHEKMHSYLLYRAIHALLHFSVRIAFWTRVLHHHRYDLHTLFLTHLKNETKRNKRSH